MKIQHLENEIHNFMAMMKVNKKENNKFSRHLLINGES